MSPATASITAFLVPRGFEGDVGRRQRNALRALRAQRLEVLLLGDEVGAAEAAAEHGARHEPDLARNGLGTPLVSDAFRRAAELAATPLLLYANADLVFLPGLREAAGRVRRERYLGVGRRTDVALDEELTLEPGWEARLEERARRDGRLDSPFAIDWFLLPRTLELDMPPFAVGRPGWDNWVIGRARGLGLPVVDFTPAVTVLHQRHEYGHVHGAARRWYGPEAEANRALAAGVDVLGILDATHVVGRRAVLPALAPRYLRPRLARLRERDSALGRLVDAVARARPRRLRA